MNIKKQNKYYFIILITGLILFGLNLFLNLDSYYMGLLSGISSALIVVAGAKLIKNKRVQKDPVKEAEFEAAYTDERIKYISNKARSIVFLISIYLELFLGLFISLVLKQHSLGSYIHYFVCLQCFAYLIVYKILNNKE